MMSIINDRGLVLSIWILPLFVALSGCTGHVANLSLVSTRTVDLENVSMDPRKGQRVTGDDCGYALLGIIPFTVPNLEDAVDDALEQGQGNVLVEAESTASFFHAILFSQSCIEVSGTVLKIPEKS